MKQNSHHIFEQQFTELFKNRIETRIIKKHLKKMKEYVGIYIKTEKSTGTRWLWQQNEIPLPHNNPT